jgi:hypothetical protein
MQLSRRNEWIVIWLATIVFFIFSVLSLVHANLQGFFYGAGGYAAFIILIQLFFPRLLPPAQRVRDPIPWDKSAITNSEQISELKAAVPSLAVARIRDRHRLWTAEHKGTNGTWLLSVEDCGSAVVGYYLQYKHLYSTALDYGESRPSSKAVFIVSSD